MAFAVWGWIISHQVPNRGRNEFTVEVDPGLVAYQIGKVTEEEVRRQIEEFCQPDEKSRTKDEEGRKLVEINPYCYRVVNGAYYDQLRREEHRREYNRVRQANLRAMKRSGPVPIIGGAEIRVGVEEGGLNQAPAGPTREMALAWGKKLRESGTADFADDEVLDAWLYFESNGWKRGERTRIVDYRTALEGRIRDRRTWKEQNESKRAPAGQRGAGPAVAARDDKAPETGRSIGTFNQGRAHLYRGRELRPDPAAAATAAEEPHADSPKPV